MDKIHWDTILSEFETVMDHKSIQSFCTRHHISSKELKYHFDDYKKKLSKNEVICVDVGSGFKDSKSKFLTLECNDVRIRVYQNFDSNLLFDVLKVVKSV